MGAIPAWHAARRPDALAVIHDKESLNWAGLARNVARGADALRTAGVEPNDCVALVLPNGNRFIEATFAIWAAGGTPLPLSPRLPRAELMRLLELARPRLVIDDDWSPIHAAEALPMGPPARFWKAIASGGSTGRPKLILSDRPAVSDPSTYELFPWELHQGRLGIPNGIMLNPGPLYHNGPFVHAFMNLFAGSTLIGMPRFDAEEWLRLVERHRVGFSYLVPAMMHRIWSLPDAVRSRYDLTSLAGVIHTAAPCPDWLKRAWIEWLGPDRIWETYGSTEAVASSLINGAEWLEHPGSVGRFFFGAQGKVLDESDAALPPGEIGDLWVRSSPDRGTGFAYVGDEPRERDGWFNFGDLAAIDDEGYVHIADRRTDLIIRGGNNIYPAEVEAAIEAHPDVLAAAVIGLPDEEMGARVHAIVKCRPGCNPDLAAFLGDRLAPYKRPATFEFAQTPLRDDSGKIRRSKLREERL